MKVDLFHPNEEREGLCYYITCKLRYNKYGNSHEIASGMLMIDMCYYEWHVRRIETSEFC
jgi:hypothetical protein